MKPSTEDILSQAIQSRATRFRAPAAVRERIVTALRLADSAPAATPQKSFWTPLQRAWFGTGLAFALGAITSASVLLLQGAGADDERLTQEVVAGHVRSLMVAHLSDVASSDQHTVKPWFNGKLDFSPPVHDLSPEGYALLGGRLDYLNRRPVAALVYRHRLHTINLFIAPVSIDADSKTRLLSQQGFNVAEWKTSGMRYWAVSDLNAGELQSFTQLLRQKAGD